MREAFWKERLLAALVLLLLGVTIGSMVQTASNEIVLTLGVYADLYGEAGSEPCYDIIDAAIARFEEAHPDVRVQYVSGITSEEYDEWLAEQIVLGDLPDVFFLPKDGVDELLGWDVLADLTEPLERETRFGADDFYSAALEAGQRGGVQVALPFACDPRLMFVNRTLLDRNGINMPRSSWEWDDLYEICEELTLDMDGDGFLEQYGIQGYQWTDALAANGQRVFAEDGSSCTLTTGAVENALAFYTRLYNLCGEELGNTDAFWQGRCAFLPMSLSEFRSQDSVVNKIMGATFRWDCVPMPSGDYSGNTAWIESVLVGMDRKANYADLAWELLATLTADTEVQRLVCGTSGTSVIRTVGLEYALVAEVSEDAEDFLIEWTDRSLVRSGPAENFTNRETMYQLLDAEISRLVTQRHSAESMLPDIQREINKEIEQHR